jgi:hypothetical protein
MAVVEMAHGGQGSQRSDRRGRRVGRLDDESNRQRSIASRFQEEVSRKYGNVCLKRRQADWSNGVMEWRSDGEVGGRKFADSRDISS